jgi:hypothetical protein
VGIWPWPSVDPTIGKMERSPTTCARHPDVETRLSCSACGTPICPDCGREAAVGFKCPACAAHLEATTSPRRPDTGRLAGLRSGSRSGPVVRPPDGGVPTGRLPLALGVRATGIGLFAALVGGGVLSPVLQGGAFFLLTSGLIGWAVARAVFWASAERSSPYLRAIALTLAGFSVAVALGIATSWTAGNGTEILLLAYPAALYGGWIVVRNR